jgi:PAS domain S-box
MKKFYDDIDAAPGKNMVYEQMAATLECIGDGVISTDVNCTVTFMNSSAEYLTGWKFSEAMGKKLSAVMPIIDTQKNEVLECPVWEPISSGVVRGLKNNSAFISRDGSIKLVSATCSPIRDNYENITGSVMVFRDITKLKQIEEELIEERNNFRAMFEASPIGIVIINSQRTVVQANNTFLRMFGDARSDVVGKRMGEVFCCINRFNSFEGCGHSQMCRVCQFDRIIENVLDTGIGHYEAGIQHNLLIDGEVSRLWLVMGFMPVRVSGQDCIMIAMDDITEEKNAEEGLKRYQILTERVRDIILFYSEDGRIIDANYAAVKAYGYSYDELLSMTVFNLRNDATHIQEQLHTASSEGVFFETVHFRKDGSSFPVEVSSNSTIINGEKVILGIIRDISERKQVEVALKDSEERYRQLFNNITDAIVAHEVDENNIPIKCIEVNDTACEMFGCSKEEIMNMDLLAIRADQDLEMYMPLIEEIDRCNHVTFERAYPSRFGGFRAVEVHSHKVVLNGQKAILSVIRDITERKRAEDTVRESQAKYQSLFMNMTDAFVYYKILFDEKNEPYDIEYVEVNSAFQNIFKIKLDDVRSNTFTKVFPSFSAFFVDYVKKNYEGNFLVKNIRIPEYHSHRLHRWFSISAFASGEGYYAAIISDITESKKSHNELKKAIEEAQAANRAKSEFLANMSHEIRTPLNGMIGMIDLTLTAGLSNEQKEDLTIAKSCAKSLLEIINDILDFSKMEAGKMIIENIDFDIKEIIEDVIKAHSINAEKKGLDLFYQYASGLPQYLVGDPGRLKQVLNNLVGNAVKFTDKGSVSVSVKKQAQSEKDVEVLFSVSDTGIGIAEDELSLLFKSFSQVDGSHTRKYEGTGLGLVICKQLVEMMGGKVWVKSKKGTGSTFFFMVTLKIGSGKRVNESVSPLLKRSERVLRILIVEDDAVNQMVLARMLKEIGHSVTIAGNGKEALSILKDSAFDIILMDIQMPEMDGIQATESIRFMEKGTNSHIPIIALTAYALKGDREKFLSIGMDGYISKPINIENLIELIDRFTQPKDGSINDILSSLYGENQDIKGKQSLSDEKVKEMVDGISREVDMLEIAFNNNDLLAIEDTASLIKDMAAKINEESIKRFAFRIQLAARRGNYTEASEIYNGLKSDFINFRRLIK